MLFVYCCCLFVCLFVCCFQLLHTAFNQLKHDVRQGCVHLEGIDGSTQDEVRYFSQFTCSSSFLNSPPPPPPSPPSSSSITFYHHYLPTTIDITFITITIPLCPLYPPLLLLSVPAPPPLQELFYSLSPGGTYGSVSYIAKAVVNQLLIAGIHSDPTDRNNCSIS